MSEPSSLTLTDLRRLDAAARYAKEEATKAAAAADRAYHRTHLALLEAEGLGESRDARWTRAMLTGDYGLAHRLTAEDYPRTSEAASAVDVAANEASHG